MKYIDWTDERIAELTRLWSDGLSATRIAVVMGLQSRQMVIGKVNRLELPPPAKKLPVVKDGTYVRQLPEITLENRRKRERRYQAKRRERLKHDFEAKKAVRAQFLAKGTSKTSAAYRKHLPPMPEMSKVAMREMLAQAMLNTVSP